MSPNIAVNIIEAQCVRYGFADFQIKNAFENGNTSTFNNIFLLDSAGITQVMHLTWPADTIPDVGQDLERIPTGSDCTIVFQYLDSLLLSVGPYIEWIQICQEPIGITSYDSNEYSITDILGWWTTVVNFIRSRQIIYPQLLGHLKITTGGISGIRSAIDNPGGVTAQVIDSILKFGELYCDAIDLHLHTVSLNSGRQEILFINSRTNHPLTCTEWSQANVVVDSGWINSVNTVWTNFTDPFYGFTNKDVIEEAYINPLDTSDWKMLIETIPFSPGFIPQFYEIMDSCCFLFTCYGSATQYGSPVFDWKQLLATKTVNTNLFHNQPFFNEYVNLSTLLNSGGYASQCSVAEIGEYPENNISIFPNPCYEGIWIEGSEVNSSITVSDILGNIAVQTKKMNGNFIQLSQISPGMYFLYINNGKPLKFIKH